MGLRFLADHCVPNLVVHQLRDSRHEVVRLRDVLPTDSRDTLVIAKARELSVILLSLNGDFADIVTYPPENYAGIIALQVRNHPEVLAPLLGRLIAYFDLFPTMKHYAGKLFVVEVDRIRIRQ